MTTPPSLEERIAALEYAVFGAAVDLRFDALEAKLEEILGELRRPAG
ncbi:hypothetical protein [Trebonia kvetii]|nr:hypothetical protein [Trebonia kvetii]